MPPERMAQPWAAPQFRYDRNGHAETAAPRWLVMTLKSRVGTRVVLGARKRGSPLRGGASPEGLALTMPDDEHGNRSIGYSWCVPPPIGQRLCNAVGVIMLSLLR